MTAAQSAAMANLSRNIARISNPPALAALPELTWLHGRDGSLTCKTEDGQWLLGNSLPRRTAERMLRDLSVSHTVCCFLDVPHAAFLRNALDRLRAQQAIVAVVPDSVRLHILLHCEDFSEDFCSHRLWIVAGEDWQSGLTELFNTEPGLPTPAAFVRTSFTREAVLQAMIEQAQAIFAAETARRNQAIAQYASSESSKKQSGKICVIVPSAFRLWDFAGETLVNILPGEVFDSDEPTSASPLALAMAAANCEAVVAPNIARADANGLFSKDRPWITWMTRPIIPAYAGEARDQLVLAEPAWRDAARRAGWPEKQIAVAGWPSILSPNNGGTYLAIIADTMAVAVEPDDFDLSSHSLLWETIRQQLVKDPFDLSEEPAQYLAHWLARCNVSTNGLDQARFIEKLIIPTYQQSIARLLLINRLPVRLFGSGWQSIDEFALFAGGGIDDSETMLNAISGAAGLIHAWPVRYAHPMDAMGKPVVRTTGRAVQAFLHEANLAIQRKLPLPPSCTSPLNADFILSFCK